MNGKIAFCRVSIAPIRAEKKDQAEIVSQLLFGELFTIETIDDNWTKITTLFDGYEGWIDTKHFSTISEKEAKKWMDEHSTSYNLTSVLETPWGKQTIVRGSYISGVSNQFNIGKYPFTILEKEDLEVPTSIYETALSYLNAPYLWGGKSPFGIDCSGFSQLIYRFHDINIPRDASQQIELGRGIEFDEQEEGDLAFFHNATGKIIHVGILDGKGSIIHASGCVRIDKLTKEGIINVNDQNLTHHLNCIKRY
ncbi:MAG: NlpC/P60 family protein [Crocinitomicaceae bacterium]